MLSGAQCVVQMGAAIRERVPRGWGLLGPEVRKDLEGAGAVEHPPEFSCGPEAGRRQPVGGCSFG